MLIRTRLAEVRATLRKWNAHGNLPRAIARLGLAHETQIMLPRGPGRLYSGRGQSTFLSGYLNRGTGAGTMKRKGLARTSIVGIPCLNLAAASAPSLASPIVTGTDTGPPAHVKAFDGV